MVERIVRLEQESRLKIVTIIVAACAFIGLIIIGIRGYQDRQDRLSPVGLLHARKLKEEQVASATLQDRVDVLASTRCQKPVIALLERNKVERISSFEVIPSDIRSDLALCINRGIIGAYALDQLKDAGLLDLVNRR